MTEIFSSTSYKTILPVRDSNSHKGSFGTLAAVTGSMCYQGASVLSTKSALYSGVGIVCSFIPKDIYIPFASKINGAVIEPMDCRNGIIDDSNLCSRIRARKCTAVLCGSGLGISNGSLKAVSDVLSLDLPVVLDGDALSIVSENLFPLKRKATTILTPHLGEFSRLVSKSIDEICADKITLVQNFAKENDCIVVLKSFETVVASPDRCFVINEPTSALSKGGSGDVLAGIMSSFLAQGIPAFDAAVSAVSVHNRCGHIVKEKFGEYSAQPDDYINALHSLLNI